MGTHLTTIINLKNSLTTDRAYYALVMIGVLSTAVIMAMPIMVAGIVAELGLNQQELGWIAAADMLGSIVAGLVLLPFINRISWRKAIYIALTVVALGNILSIFSDSFSSVIAMRIFTGIGNGVILSIAYTGICHTHSPDRFFGVYTFIQLAIQCVFMINMPSLIELGGMAAVYWLFAGLAVASGTMVHMIPNKLCRSQSLSDIPSPQKLSAHFTKGKTAALLATAIYFLAPAAIWGYFEPLGASFSLNLSDIGTALGVSSIVGILGALAVILLGTRLGRMRSLTTGILISIISILILLSGSGFQLFTFAASCFSFSWSFTFAYQMGVLSQFDTNGSTAITSLMVQLLGFVVGPIAASSLLFDGTFNIFLWCCIACYSVSLVLYIRANKLAKNTH